MTVDVIPLSKNPIPAPLEYTGPDRLSPLPTDLKGVVCGFLKDRDLLALEKVNHRFHSEMPHIWQALTRTRCFIPESLPPEVNHKQFLLNRFPNAIGADVYKEYLGKVGDVPRVPRHFIDMVPRPGFKLVLIPEYITITVGVQSPLILDETTQVGNRKARLIEDPERAPQGNPRQIQVPVTANNIILLAEKYLKRKLPSQFGGMAEHSWLNIIDQNGDLGVGPSHWSYQKEAVIGLGAPYHSPPNGPEGQVEIAQELGLEIVPLCERILFHLSSYLKSGKFPQSDSGERTSTVVHDTGNHSWQSVICWPASGPAFRLHLSIPFDSDRYYVGVAARVPAGSSQAIGH